MDFSPSPFLVTRHCACLSLSKDHLPLSFSTTPFIFINIVRAKFNSLIFNNIVESRGLCSADL